MNKCFLTIFATFCIMFTDMLTNNNCISMKTNKPHSDLNTLAKNNSACVYLEIHAAGSPQNQHAAGMFILWTVGGAAGVSGSATSLPGSRFPQHHLLLLIALTLSFKQGHRSTYVAHLGFVL